LKVQDLSSLRLGRDLMKPREVSRLLQSVSVKLVSWVWRAQKLHA
jgi:hypothetical protein